MLGNQYHIFPGLLIPHNVGYLDLYLDIEEGMTCIFFFYCDDIDYQYCIMSVI